MSEDKNLPLLKQKYDINIFPYYFEERPFKPLAVVLREDVPFEKESAASNFNVLMYLRLRYPESFSSNGKWHSGLIIIDDGGKV